MLVKVTSLSLFSSDQWSWMNITFFTDIKKQITQRQRYKKCMPEWEGDEHGTALAEDDGTWAAELLVTTADPDGAKAASLEELGVEAWAIGLWPLSASRLCTSSIVLLRSSISAACSWSVITRAWRKASNAFALRRLNMSNNFPTRRFVIVSSYTLTHNIKIMQNQVKSINPSILDFKKLSE